MGTLRKRYTCCCRNYPAHNHVSVVNTHLFVCWMFFLTLFPLLFLIRTIMAEAAQWEQMKLVMNAAKFVAQETEQKNQTNKQTSSYSWWLCLLVTYTNPMEYTMSTSVFFIIVESNKIIIIIIIIDVLLYVRESGVAEKYFKVVQRLQWWRVANGFREKLVLNHIQQVLRSYVYKWI